MYPHAILLVYKRNETTKRKDIILIGLQKESKSTLVS